MIDDLKNIFSKIENKDRSSLILISLFPLSLILGNLIINIFIILISINFISELKKNKIFLRDKIFFLLLFFLCSLIINLFFSTNLINSFPRVLKFAFVIFFIIEIRRIILIYKKQVINFIFKTWSLIFLVLIADISVEIIFGRNIFGISANIDGRIASFFGDELVAGAFVHGIALFFLSYLIEKNTKNYFIILAIVSIIGISFLIGERSNFLKLFFSIILFGGLLIKINFFKKILLIGLIITSLITFINFNEEYKYRYFDQIKTLYTKNGVSKFLKVSEYGAHQNVAIKIFSEYPFFGIGVKNFRFESKQEKYENKDYEATKAKNSTHPHQTHLEFLSETGLIGYLSFIIFIFWTLLVAVKEYLQSRNPYQLSAIIFIISTLIPILPSGSFLSTFTSGIFWLNFSIMISFINKRKFKS
tara:strand:- start:1237 stop:2490 length:1254 start_codon:yes stop_codon:yes gene_type:complete